MPIYPVIKLINPIFILNDRMSPTYESPDKRI